MQTKNQIHSSSVRILYCDHMFVAVFRIHFYALGKINRGLSHVQLLVEELLPGVQSTGLGSGEEFGEKGWTFSLKLLDVKYYHYLCIY